MVAVNDAKAKHYYDNKYGTGQSAWDGIMHTTNLVVAGKTVVVAGYGWCGKGVAMRAAGMGARVIVTEIDPFKALDATMNGFQVMTMDQAAPLGDDCEVAVAALREMAVQSEVRRENIVGYTLSNGHTLNVLAEGRLVNLAAGNGHPAEIMDMSFAVQALAAEWLTKQTGLEKKVYPVPDTIDDAIGRAKLAAQGLSIDALTPEQEAYLSSWSVE